MFSKCTGDASGGVGDGGGGEGGELKHLGVNFKQLLRDPVGLEAFTKFLRSERSEENIEFWQDCERYRRTHSPSLAREIWETYLKERPVPDWDLPAAEDERCKTVNVDAKIRVDIQQRLSGAPADLFEKAQEHIYRMMQFDKYQRYLKSSFHSDLVLSALGLTPPPQPNSKVKKSRSNASESGRGRGVLSRFLPKDSTNTPESRAEDARRPSSSLCENLKDLCKVILPDSKSATIQRTGDRSVRDTVDHLLHNRGVFCRDYDVYVRGGSKPVDVTRPMSELAGREVEIQRRVVLQLTLARCSTPHHAPHAQPCKWSLKARTAPDKSLETVLQSVLRRYGLSDSKVEVTLKGRPVAFDCVVEKLEGSHLEVRVLGSPASLDEITNRVFAEVLSDKSRRTDHSIKSDNGSSEHSNGAVLARLCPGTALHTAPAPLASEHQRPPAEGACGLPCATPVPAARTSIARPPRPTVRTSLARASAVLASDPSTPRTPESPRPPPLPPKPKVQPARPSNWGHAAEPYLDQPASSFV